MRSDKSMDQEIKALERQIHERRVMLRDELDDLGESARAAKLRIRQRATSPLVWATALAVGFVAARFARRTREEPRMSAYARRAWERREKPVSPGRQMLATVLSAVLPVALRIARSSAAPWIARMVQSARESMARRHAYSRAYGRY